MGRSKEQKEKIESPEGIKRNEDTFTKAVTDERIYLVYKWRLSGIVSRREILQMASKLGWGVSDRSVDFYIHEAKKIIKENAQTERKEEFETAFLRLNDLYAREYGNSNFRSCQSIQRDISELFGLYEDRVLLSGRLDINITDDEQKRIENEFGIIKRKRGLEKDFLSDVDSR